MFKRNAGNRVNSAYFTKNKVENQYKISNFPNKNKIHPIKFGQFIKNAYLCSGFYK